MLFLIFLYPKVISKFKCLMSLFRTRLLIGVYETSMAQNGGLAEFHLRPAPPAKPVSKFTPYQVIKSLKLLYFTEIVK